MRSNNNDNNSDSQSESDSEYSGEENERNRMFVSFHNKTNFLSSLKYKILKKKKK